MPRKQGELTVKRIEKLGPGRHADGHGLYLQVVNDANKSWLFRYALDGTERWMGLGALHTVGLDEARERARKQRLALLDGIDPLAQKREQREQRRMEASAAKAALAKRKTFTEVAEEFLAKHSEAWTNTKHRKQWRSTLATYAYPVIGDLFVGDIDVPLIVKVLERDNLWSTRRETGRRLLNRLERVLHFAKAAGYRTGENPAAWSHLQHLLPNGGQSNGHHAALPYAEIPTFMRELRQSQGVPARALEFTILCSARLSESIGAVWDEIDFKAATWNVPAERMKSRRPHKVPLSAPAIALLKELQREPGNPHIFVGKPGKAVTPVRVTYQLQRLGRGDVTTHGFRSSFSDWAHEQTGHSNHEIELSLAHSIGSAVEKAYRRGDMYEKRRRLMQSWADYCASPPAATKENVVALRSA
jgi:integrase